MKTSNVKQRPFWRKKRFWLLAILAIICAFLLSNRGVRIMLQTSGNTPRGAAASPVLIAENLSDWEDVQRPGIQSQLQTQIYGRYPADLTLDVISSKTLPGTFFDDSARIEVQTLEIRNPQNDKKRAFGLVILRPITSKSPSPIIISQNFCPNHNVIPIEDIPKPGNISFDCSGDGMMFDVFSYFFGRYITTPPIKDIMDRGYAFAAMYPTEFIPDQSQAGLAALNDFFDGDNPNIRPGALMAWAAQFNLVANHLETEFSRSILYGHSRFGKTSLIAAGFNPEIDAVLAHQSGTGGASLSRNKPGETIADITRGYPHWFGGKYPSYSEAQSALPIDQHHLLALIAPRPVLLGNARRDVWSDPNGGFRAAQGANPAYLLYDDPGLTAKKLSDFNPSDSIAYWIRPGTHGVVKEDWPAFLDFLDAQLPKE